VSSFKLKTIFYESEVPPIRNPIFSRYQDQTINAITIDDTKSKRRSGGRPSIKGVLGLNLGSGEEYLLYLGAVKSWSEVLYPISKRITTSLTKRMLSVMETITCNDILKNMATKSSNARIILSKPRCIICGKSIIRKRRG